ncbi:MAG: 50S ribosomal protein L23 [Nitrospirota bacterium]|nr:50S ribosomal protein L23 [Nitrospirota bacterium]
MQRDPHTILIKPVLSEKSMADANDGRCVVFEIARSANKVEVAKAVETIFNVKVAKVNTAMRKGKVKRQGRSIGRRPDRKRATVTLAEGHTLNLFE